MLDSPGASINPAWRCLGHLAHQCTPSPSRMLSACPFPAPSPAEISAFLPRQAAPAVPAPPAQARPSSRDNVQRATSVPSLSSISSPEGLSGGGEGRGGRRGEGRGGRRPTPSLSSRAFSCTGWVGKRVKLQLEELCPRRCTLGGRGGRVPVLGGWGGKRVPMPRVVGVLRHRMQAEVGPCLPRQWEWKVSHGHLPTCTVRGGRGHLCTRRPEHLLG